ncbi:DUF1214 domain-containing protein [uncultured Methylovirgula sp.]|uniref:DUF1214 domain-containing protein n=1 Tax=uncultured Methylovirgula sp. TaxID=1285960 RepID=UPI00262A700E|nr:DUF1214 domain-containing protein [uncultured Methylovirgula sp.]
MTIIKFLLTALAGIILGFLVTTRVLDRGLSFDAAQAGPWRGQPKSGTMDIDPYANARIARTAELPLGSAEGLSFVARNDSDGAPLRPECDYIVSGSVPPTRYWTLTLVSPKGFLIANKAQRFGFTSAEVVRAENGTFAIVVARDARAGNWLPVGDAKSFALMLRLYDTLLDFGTTKVGANALPKITRGRCA